jgi:hypothetical protein
MDQTEEEAVVLQVVRRQEVLLQDDQADEV